MDLACGRGGYGLEIAGRTGTRLVGVDFSAEAVRQARAHARRLGAAAQFRVGDLARTGLEAGSADAVLCVDAIHFARQPGAAYRLSQRCRVADIDGTHVRRRAIGGQSPGKVLQWALRR